MADFLDPGPALARVPDARRAPFPLLPAISYVYLALLIGIVPTCVLLLGTAMVLRRGRLAVAALGLGLLGFLAPIPGILWADLAGGEPNIAMIRLVIRVVGVGLGFAAFKLAHGHVRGHLQLKGEQVPLLWVIGVAFASQFIIPSTVQAWLEFPLIMMGALG